MAGPHSCSLVFLRPLPFITPLTLLALVVAFAAFWPFSGLQARVFDAQQFTLDNGLTVVVVENHRAPIVHHMVWYKVGAADEAPGESGNAHFLEHLMFKGTESLAPGEFSEIVARNGGRENAFTSWDYTAFYQTVAKDRLDIVMGLEADRMVNLVLTDEVVLPEREVVREERRSRVDNDPSGQLGEVARASLYLNHPYRIPIIGWDHEITELNTQTVLDFYKRWYAPNNAIVVISGDVSLDEVKALAEKHYGAIPAKDLPGRDRIAEPPHNAERRITLESPRVNQPSVSIRYLAPSYRTGTNGEAYALQVLSEILGGGSSSRLYSELVVDQGLASAAGGGYGADSYDLTSFNFFAAPRPDKDIDEVEDALRAQIERVRSEGVTAEEVAAAQKRLISAAVFARDSLGAGPSIIGRAMATGRSLAEVENWPDLIQEVTVEQVNAAARQVFDDKSSVTAVLLPEPLS
ncbi:MAG: pitrilysin family protein [Pseudomonadota bacterium]